MKYKGGIRIQTQGGWISLFKNLKKKIGILILEVDNDTLLALIFCILYLKKLIIKSFVSQLACLEKLLSFYDLFSRFFLLSIFVNCPNVLAKGFSWYSWNNQTKDDLIIFFIFGFMSQFVNCLGEGGQVY